VDALVFILGLAVAIALLLTYVYFVLYLLYKIIKFRKLKYAVGLLIITSPIIYLFLYYLSPSYHQFKELCERDDRKTIYTKKEVDFIYLGRSSLCEEGFEFLSTYKGIECDFAPKGDGLRGNWKDTYRYIKGDNWNSSSCGNTCKVKRGADKREECYFSCMKQMDTYEFTNPFSRELVRSELASKRLYLVESRIVAEGEIMATAKNYRFYPYWDIWATFWTLGGLVHGGPPSMSCDEDVFIDKTDVYRPSRL